MTKNYCNECDHARGYDNAYCHCEKHRELEGGYPVLAAVRKIKYYRADECPDWIPREERGEKLTEWERTYRHPAFTAIVIIGLCFFLISMCTGCTPEEVCAARDLACAHETLRLEREILKHLEDGAAKSEELYDLTKYKLELEREIRFLQRKQKDSAFACMRLCGGFSSSPVTGKQDLHKPCSEECRYTKDRVDKEEEEK